MEKMPSARMPMRDRLDSLAYTPLSEARVVSQLIQDRSTLDAGYLSAGGEAQALDYGPGAYDPNEDVVCVYADLDTQIDACGMTAVQRDTVNLLMAGYTAQDIAQRRRCVLQTVLDHFTRAVERIVRQNNVRWAKTYTKETNDQAHKRTA